MDCFTSPLALFGNFPQSVGSAGEKKPGGTARALTGTALSREDSCPQRFGFSYTAGGRHCRANNIIHRLLHFVWPPIAVSCQPSWGRSPASILSRRPGFPSTSAQKLLKEKMLSPVTGRLDSDRQIKRPRIWRATTQCRDQAFVVPPRSALRVSNRRTAFSRSIWYLRFIATLLSSKHKHIPSLSQAQAESRYFLRTNGHPPIGNQYRLFEFSILYSDLLHLTGCEMASLWGLNHLEPTGSGRATPPSTFQNQTGNPRFCRATARVLS